MTWIHNNNGCVQTISQNANLHNIKYFKLITRVLYHFNMWHLVFRPQFPADTCWWCFPSGHTGNSAHLPLFGPVFFGTGWLFLCYSNTMPVGVEILFYGRIWDTVKLLSVTRTWYFSQSLSLPFSHWSRVIFPLCTETEEASKRCSAYRTRMPASAPHTLYCIPTLMKHVMQCRSLSLYMSHT